MNASGRFLLPLPVLTGRGLGEGLYRQTRTRGWSPHPPRAERGDLSPPAGRGLERKPYAAFGSAALVSAKAQSIHCVRSATSLASTVAPHQIRRPAGASR